MALIYGLDRVVVILSVFYREKIHNTTITINQLHYIYFDDHVQAWVIHSMQWIGVVIIQCTTIDKAQYLWHLLQHLVLTFLELSDAQLFSEIRTVSFY